MQFDQNPVNMLAPLPAKNIDTGLGLNRLALIEQGKPSVFETDQFAPLIALGEELSGRRYGEDYPTDRGLRLLADHSRAMTFLIADGVVPSNEDRGYVLRRIMRRAIQHGRSLELPSGFLIRYQDVVTELMGAEYPELHTERDLVRKWLESEEEGFGRTLEQGLKRLDELIERARHAGDEGIAADDAFLLHDTYGFPIDLTLELVAEQGLGIDEEGFEALMEGQRERARASAGRFGGGAEEVRERARGAGPRSRLRDRLRRLRDDRPGDHDRRRGGRERQDADQARGVALLRHGRRPGGRLGLRRVPARGLPRARRGRAAPRG